MISATFSGCGWLSGVGAGLGRSRIAVDRAAGKTVAGDLGNAGGEIVEIPDHSGFHLGEVFDHKPTSVATPPASTMIRAVC